MSLKVENCLKQDAIVHLDVSHSDINDKTLFKILQKNKKTIRSVTLSNCPKITDCALLYLSEVENLSGLILDGCTRITDTGLKYLASSKPQSWFEYLFSKPSVLKQPPALSRLTGLSLRGCYEISRQGLNNLSDFPQLESLDIRACTHIRPIDISDVIWDSTQHQINHRQVTFSFMQNIQLLSTYGTLQPNSDQTILHQIIVDYLPIKTLQVKRSTEELPHFSLYMVCEV